MLVIFDLDGTLSDSSHRQHFVQQRPKDFKSFYEQAAYDPPNDPVLNTYLALDQEAHDLILVSGRPNDYREITEEWLHEYVWIFRMTLLFMRKSGDFRPDYEIKREILYDNIIPVYGKPGLAFDDRDQVVQMWRAEGIPCFQVAEGSF